MKLIRILAVAVACLTVVAMLGGFKSANAVRIVTAEEIARVQKVSAKDAVSPYGNPYFVVESDRLVKYREVGGKTELVYEREYNPATDVYFFIKFEGEDYEGYVINRNNIIDYTVAK